MYNVKFIFVVAISLLCINGCNTELTQNDCLKNNEFLYQGKCVDYDEIPEEDKKSVWDEVALEIAEAQGITFTEAYEIILANINQYEE